MKLPDVLGGQDRRSRQELIGANITDVIALQSLVRQTGSSYERVLSGNTEASRPLPNQGAVPDEAILERLGWYERHLTEHKQPGFTLRTVRGYNQKLAQKQALGEPDIFDQYKLYLSLDLTNEENVAIGSELYEEVVTKSYEAGVSIASKYWVAHAYDALILYMTSLEDTVTVAESLVDAYPNYNGTGVFHSVPRIFQGTIEGINSDHVGWAQEPCGLPGSRSHSRRMAAFGSEIDRLGLDNIPLLKVGAFALAASNAGVDPARPYLLAATGLQY